MLWHRSKKDIIAAQAPSLILGATKAGIVTKYSAWIGSLRQCATAQIRNSYPGSPVRGISPALHQYYRIACPRLDARCSIKIQAGNGRCPREICMTLQLSHNPTGPEHPPLLFTTIEIDLSFFLPPEIQLGAVAIVGLFYLIKDLGLIIWKPET